MPWIPIPNSFNCLNGRIIRFILPKEGEKTYQDENEGITIISRLAGYVTDKQNILEIKYLTIGF